MPFGAPIAACRVTEFVATPFDQRDLAFVHLLRADAARRVDLLVGGVSMRGYAF